MRLVTVNTEEGTRAAVQRGGSALPVPAPVGEPPYEDVGALLRRRPGGLAAARRTLADGGEEIAIDPERVLRPVLSPSAVVCVGLNYRTHILEMGRELPSSPTLFSKLARALTDPYAEVALPQSSSKVDYEGELAVVIGEPGRNVPRDRAWEHVAGLTILNDVTARDFQRRSVQWFAGKSFEASTPVGPAIVTLDELSDNDQRELWVTVNGEERQRAPIADLVFDVPALVADLSRIVTLEPGDIIATGTPGGVGESSDRFLGDGDVVEVGIDDLGTIRNTFRRA